MTQTPQDKVNQLIAAHDASRVAAAAAAGPDHLDYLLIDGSGSMEAKWWNFLTAAQCLLDDVRNAGINSHLFVHVFDATDISMVQRDGPLAIAQSLTDVPISSHFTGTPLYDAINVMGRKLQKLSPIRASLLIVTDGHDNASVTSVVQARAVLDWCRAQGWQVTFLGCDFDSSSQAKELGVNARNAIGVRTDKLVDAAHTFAGKRIRYGQSGDEVGFTDEEKSRFGGFLGNGSQGDK